MRGRDTLRCSSTPPLLAATSPSIEFDLRMSSSSSTAPAVGSRVRVTTSDGARRALLLCVHDATVEVEYETGGEAVVPLSAISALLPFEDSLARAADETAIAYAERCKSEGNSLYKLRDASAAAARYADGANALQQAAQLNDQLSEVPSEQRAPGSRAIQLHRPSPMAHVRDIPCRVNTPQTPRAEKHFPGTLNTTKTP